MPINWLVCDWLRQLLRCCGCWCNATIRLCLQLQNTEQVGYQGMGENEAEEPEAVLPARRVGRNEPCPCGSGKKYK
jgi:uncharacterized protein YecA (UPF0149 family)